MLAVTLAKNLERLRLERGYTKREVARLAGLTDASLITYYSQGKHKAPRMEYVAAIARVFGMTADQLITPQPEEGGEWQVSPVEATIRRRVTEQATKAAMRQFIQGTISQHLARSDVVCYDAGDDGAGVVPPGHERAPVYGLRFGAEVARLLAAEVGDQDGPTEVAMFESRRRRGLGSRVIGFEIQGDYLAPLVPTGAVIMVEVVEAGWHPDDLPALENMVVLASVGSTFHFKVLRKRAHGYVLAPIKGHQAILMTPEVKVVGVVIEQHMSPVVPEDNGWTEETPYLVWHQPLGHPQ